MADINSAKILQSERERLYIRNVGDRPNAMNSYQKTKMTAQEVKGLFDKQFDFLADKHNILLNEVIGSEGERQEMEDARAEKELHRQMQEKLRMLNEYGNENYSLDEESGLIVDQNGDPVAEEALGGRQGAERQRNLQEEARELQERQRNANEYGNPDYKWDADQEAVVDGEGNVIPPEDVGGRHGEFGDLAQAVDEIHTLTEEIVNDIPSEPIKEINERLVNLDENIENIQTDISNNSDNIENAQGRLDDLETFLGTDDQIPGSSLFLKAYPVGSIYMSVNATDPASLFGGSWVRLKDRFLLGANNESGEPTYNGVKTGGETSHTLTANEMPAHSGHIHELATSNYYLDIKVLSSQGTYGNGWKNESGEAYPVHKTLGGSAAHNNMPPYLAVYMWKRVEEVEHENF